MHTWHLLDITHILFLLVKLYPEMNVCERMSVSMTATCNPMCALLTRWAFLWSACGKRRGHGLGAEGVWFPPGGLRGHLRPEGPLRNAWLITKGVINYAGWGVQNHSVNIGLGARKKKGGDAFHPSGYAGRFITIMILLRTVLPEGQICFYVVQFKKNPS